MKKLFLLFIMLASLKSQAIVWTVTVEDFQFSPANLNVAVGDVIHFEWVSGFHTTTSTSVPSGAGSWDETLTGAGETFNYTVTAVGAYEYQCNFHAAQMQGTFTASNVTPVTLGDFSISGAKDKAILSWTTHNELNSDHFSIRKSIDGTEFKEINSVPAAGNSSVTKLYSFTDWDISSSLRYIYYSLSIVDKDGKTQLSPIKVFKNPGAHPKLAVSLSPNPVGGMGHLLLKFNADKTGVMNARIIDGQGRVLLQANLSATEGINNGHIHLGELAKGTYTLRLTLDEVGESHIIVRN